jgi:hypothetical protein
MSRKLQLLNRLYPHILLTVTLEDYEGCCTTTTREFVRVIHGKGYCKICRRVSSSATMLAQYCFVQTKLRPFQYPLLPQLTSRHSPTLSRKGRSCDSRQNEMNPLRASSRRVAGSLFSRRESCALRQCSRETPRGHAPCVGSS